MPIQHTVVFSLAHARGSDAEREFLSTGATRLTSIPGVSDFAVNEQVSPDSDLAWQFSMFFADQGAYDTYNEHPTHVEFVSTRWTQEVVAFQEYDFVTYTPSA